MRKILTEDEKYMKEAIRQAKKAWKIEEVPIGCVIVYQGKIIGRGYNRRTTDKNPLAHAEISAIKKASKVMGDWRLEECTLYVTLEPCQMCSGALVQSRIDEVVIGCMNAKAGCAGSVMNLLQVDGFNHQVKITQGVLEEECSSMLSEFFRKLREKKKQEKKDSILTGIVMVVSVFLALAVFLALPYLVSELLRYRIPSPQLRGLLEGVIRVILFVAYVKLISLMEDIHRVFMYHGAEHKCINCIENGMDLTVENARKSSTAHKRCGTSFLLIVMFVSILLFMFIVVGNVWLRMLLRILLIPVIAGLSFEFIRYAGNHDNALVRVLSKPGMWLQSLTTKEPDDSMLEVAIASVEAVFDWKSFVRGETEKEEAAQDDEEEIEVLALDEDEDDEILNALDRYFEAPGKAEKES